MAKVWVFWCEGCQWKTLHAEDPVPDKESATVWHCLYCGTEHRPDEPGAHGLPAELPDNPVDPGSGYELIEPYKFVELLRELSREMQRLRRVN